MIVSFFKTNHNHISYAFNYLLNEDRVKNHTAEIIKGDPELATEIENVTLNKVKYISGVLSFKEKPDFINTLQQLEIIEEFEEMLIPDFFLREKLNFTWIKHTDKGRLELNFVLNLKFNDLNNEITAETYHFYHFHHRKKIEAFQNFIDYKYALTSAKQGCPNLEKTKFKKFNRKPTKNDLRETVHQIIMSHPELITRNDLIHFLMTNTQTTSTFKIVQNRITKNAFSVVDLSKPNASNTRIKLNETINLNEYRKKFNNVNNNNDHSITQSDSNDLKDKLEQLKNKTNHYDRKKYYGNETRENFKSTGRTRKKTTAEQERKADSNNKIRIIRNTNGINELRIRRRIINNTRRIKTELNRQLINVNANEYLRRIKITERKFKSIERSTESLRNRIHDFKRNQQQNKLNNFLIETQETRCTYLNNKNSINSHLKILFQERSHNNREIKTISYKNQNLMKLIHNKTIQLQSHTSTTIKPPIPPEFNETDFWIKTFKFLQEYAEWLMQLEKNRIQSIKAMLLTKEIQTIKEKISDNNKKISTFTIKNQEITQKINLLNQRKIQLKEEYIINYNKVIKENTFTEKQHLLKSNIY